MTSQTGWIKLHRRLLDSPTWLATKPPTRLVMITLLLMVNHQDQEWYDGRMRILIRRGSCFTSLEAIARKAALTVQNVRTSLQHLQNLGFLTNESTKRGRLITVVNYSIYQGRDNKSNKQTNRRLTKNQQRPNKHSTENMRIFNYLCSPKNVRMKRKKYIYSDSFLSFWEEYPKKESKRYAFQCWERVIREGATPEQIMAHLREYNKRIEGEGIEPRFIKNPSTFLNQIDFKDEPERYEKRKRYDESWETWQD